MRIKEMLKQSKNSQSNSKKINHSIHTLNNRYTQTESESKDLEEVSQQDFLADLQNLDIDPIENKNGDKFVIDEVEDNNFSSYSSKISSKINPQQQITFAQSTVWPDVFYSKKNIMSLLQQRNDVCQMYNLNSKSLKLSNNLATKRIYSDIQIVHYVKQLFQQSPSYNEYDSMCFTVIPEISQISQKYFVFMSSDLKFVPQCKNCNCVVYLILNVQKKPKNNQTFSSFSEVSSQIKGKIFCSYKNCKKKVLGQFAMSNHENKKYQTQPQISNNSKHFTQHNQTKEFKRSPIQEKQPELSEKQKMMIRKAALKLNI